MKKFNTFEEFETEFNNSFNVKNYKEHIEHLLKTYYNVNVGFTYEDILKIIVMNGEDHNEKI